MKVIFLDIDGVLNGYTKNTGRIFKLAEKLGCLRKLRDNYDIFGVRTWKVFLLSLIVKSTGAKIVISSSWRFGWYLPYEEKGRRQKSLHDKLNLFGLEVIGITDVVNTELYHSYRELEIRKWLDEHDDVDKFIVLDDESYDLHGFIGHELIKTSGSVTITGNWDDNCGLKFKHVIKAIKLLNKKEVR